VAAAAIRLKIALVLAVWQIFALRENGLVRRKEMVADRFRQGKTALESPVRDVVKENPADAPRLAAMLQKKIVVAPAFVLRIEIIAKGRQRVATCAMEMHGIFGISVIGRHVHAAAEPPDWSPHARGFRRHALPTA